MDAHTTAGGAAIPCTRESLGRCAICDRIDPDSPAYDEAYRRIFHPGEFPGDPAPEVVSTPTAATLRTPLAGDLVEAAARRIGADRLAKWVAAKLGKDDCGCERRRDALNALDAKLRKYLGS